MHAMESDKDYEFNINYDIGLKQTFMWVNCIVRNKSGKFLGLIGTGIPVSDFIDSLYSSLPKECSMYIYNKNLETTGSTEISHLENKVLITKLIPEFEGHENELVGMSNIFIDKSDKVFAFEAIEEIEWNIVVFEDYIFNAFVSSDASKSSSEVADGVGFLEENVRQLQEIASMNLNTISGIKDLGDKIENIWDIVTLINSVADQAKIIAFNAELEASSAGGAGRNFHIVASEIRRLADGIINGTKEIKERISLIQESSDSLIVASENGTELIQQGVENAKSMEERFTSIKDASESTADSASKINEIIQQQTAASEQILVTLKQIASGAEKFMSATEHISQSSQNLKTIAEGLSDKNKGSEALE